MTLNFTLLTEEQIFGNEVLDVINKYGQGVAPTDLAILQGANMAGPYGRTRDGYETCASLTATQGVCVAPTGRRRRLEFPEARYPAVRPVLLPKETAKITPKKREKGIDGIDIVEYGEYPQRAVTEFDTIKSLETNLKKDTLKTTGKFYTFDSVEPSNSRAQFDPVEHPEYELDGKKYIRVIARPEDDNTFFSNGTRVKSGEPVWVEVLRGKWFDSNGTWISTKCLFSGIQFRQNGETPSKFDDTFIKHYLDTYFAKEIEPSQTIERTKRKEIANSVSKGGLKDFLASKAKRLDKVSDSVRKSLKEKGLTGKALHDTEQKERLKVSKAILKQRQGTK